MAHRVVRAFAMEGTLAERQRLIVITGGPGAGKSTLVEALARYGVCCMPEGERAIIRQQQAITGDALPWGDRMKFAELMLSWDLRSYSEAADAHETVVFDRGIPDTIGYLQLCGLPVAPHFTAAARAFPYRREVFIAPPWPEIFAKDAERRQSADEAEETFRAVGGAYIRLGYELVILPRAPVKERAKFVLARIRLP
jgi:predicted ATPase